MNTFRDIARYLRVYRRYIGRRMYLVFGLTTLTALAQGFGITLLLPLLRASQTTGGQASGDMGTAEEILHGLLEGMGIADSMPGILAFIAAVFVAKGALQTEVEAVRSVQRDGPSVLHRAQYRAFY